MSNDTNTGTNNSGYYNSGNRNSGDYNSGYRNSGNRNSGDYNSRDYNSGNRNSGYYNSGYYNSGNRNSGDYNSGNRNSGDYNSGYYNSGAFNRDCPKMRLFEKELDMTIEEFYKKYSTYAELKLNEWVPSDVMTEQEKKDNPFHTTTGGFLRTREYKDAWRLYWKETNDEGRNKFLSLPGFDAEIFFDITGVDVRVQPKEEPKEVTMEELSALLGYEVKIKK